MCKNNKSAIHKQSELHFYFILYQSFTFSILFWACFPLFGFTSGKTSPKKMLPAHYKSIVLVWLLPAF